MSRLILFELKKTFLKPVFFLIIGILLCVNFFSIYMVRENSTYLDNALLNGSENGTWGDIYWDIYTAYSGEMDIEKIKEILSVYRPIESKVSDLTASSAGNVPNTLTGNVWSDYYLLKWLYVTPMEYMWTYRSTAEKIVTSANENIAFYSDYGNDYKVLENKKIVDLFSDRSVQNFEYTEMVNEYAHYDFSKLLLIIILIFAVTNIFISEKESKTDGIISASISGGKKTLFAKIFALMIFITAMSILFWLFDLISFIIVYGVAEGMFSTCAIYLFVAQKLKNSLAVFITNFAISAFIVGIGRYFENLTGGFAKAVNPYSLIFNESLFSNYEFINVFGFPFLTVWVSLLISTITWGIFISLVIYIYPKNYHLKRRNRV